VHSKQIQKSKCKNQNGKSKFKKENFIAEGDSTFLIFDI